MMRCVANIGAMWVMLLYQFNFLVLVSVGQEVLIASDSQDECRFADSSQYMLFGIRFVLFQI